MKRQLYFSFLSLLFPCALFAAPIKLALNWKAEPQFGGFYAAKFGGHFDKNKLEVEITEGGSGTPTIQMISSGKTDYAIVSADEVIIAHDRGAKDVIAVFATYQTNPQGIMVHEESKFDSLEKVLKSEGTLLWQEGLPYAQFLKKKYSPFKIKTAPYLGGIGNFQKDPSISQQCFVTSEPLMAKKAGLKVKSFLIAESGYNPYTTVLVTKASRFKEKPDEVRKMVNSVRQAWNEYLKNPDITNKKMAEINKSMSLEAFKESAESQKNLIETAGAKNEKLGSMSLERWQTLADQLFELKLIKQKINPSSVFVNL